MRLFSSPKRPYWLWGSLSLLFNGHRTGRGSPGGKAGGTWGWQFHLVMRLRLKGAVPLPHLYDLWHAHWLYLSMAGQAHIKGRREDKSVVIPYSEFNSVLQYQKNKNMWCKVFTFSCVVHPQILHTQRGSATEKKRMSLKGGINSVNTLHLRITILQYRTTV